MTKIDKILIAIVVVLLLASSGTAFYFYKKSTAVNKDSAAVVQEETNDLVARVGKLILLPQGETPTVATVSDPEKLKDQPFFANAKTGYKVLLYQQAKKVYLYDPVGNKIVEVAPINVGANTSANTAAVGNTQVQTPPQTTIPTPDLAPVPATTPAPTPKTTTVPKTTTTAPKTIKK